VGGLSQRGYQITVLSPKPLKQIEASFPTGVTLLHYPNLRALHLPSSVGGVLALPKVWKLRQLKSLYVRSSPGTLAITWFGSLARFKFIAVEHNGWLADEVTSFGYSSFWTRFVTWSQVWEAKLASANRVVTTQLQNLLADRGVDRDKLVVIGNGTDTRVFYPLDREECRRRMGISEDTKKVLAFVGNLWPGAGVETILRAMQLLKTRGRQIELIVAGDGVSRGHIEAAAKKLLESEISEPSSSVRFLGHLPPIETNVVLGAADVAVAPYLGERNTTVGISPLKLYAYAAAGRACVLSSLPGTEELASEPWIFQAEPGSPQSFANAIERALASDPRITSETARSFAEQNDWAMVAHRVSELMFGCTDSPIGGVRAA
jgi:glycosyltransferase involved in cell wall biosynthesis